MVTGPRKTSDGGQRRDAARDIKFAAARREKPL
jgi:hypothetical protein